MIAFAKCITLIDNRLGVVVEDLPGHALQGLEQRVMAGDQCLGPLIGREPNPPPAAVAERRGEGIQGITATSEHDEVALHLLARRRLEPHDGIMRR